ncbi:MAG TPA: efflux RND transporter periplasmic adaptor subunit, partial [Chthoniobacteraceae bacterium]|nr:efflux RND transporter periplasmic adaptor subunit [Chthoniobacteraceae bacterium]
MKSNNKGGALVGWVIVLGFLAVTGFFGYRYWQNSHKTVYQFDTQPAKLGDITQSVTATGTLNPVINVQVGSQVSGNIKSLGADWNSKVTAGQVVAQIDPALFKAQVTQAQGNLDNAKAALKLANIQLDRTKDLRAKDSTPQSALDQAQATVDQATAQVETTQGALDLAKANLKNCDIVSPVDGIVISRNVDVGQTVAAGLNAPVVFVIAKDLSKMQIDTNVSEADIGNVTEGLDVDFKVDAFPYNTFHGKVTQVRNSPTTVQNVVTYDAVISVANDDLKLKPGMTANLTVIVQHKENVLQIPNSAFRVRMPEELLAPSPSPAPSASTAAAASPAQGPDGNNGGGKHKGGGDPALRLQRTVYVLPAG